MIHVLTVHFKTLEWVPIQHKYLEVCLDDYRVSCFIDEVDFSPWPFDFEWDTVKSSDIKTINSIGHSIKLDTLANSLSSYPDDDIIIFLDGDAFPIQPLNEFIERSLEDSELIAVVREEMGHKFPHPSFTCCRLGFWRKHNLTWEVDFDTGGRLLKYLKSHNITWKRLLRTSSVGSHPVYFGIYGDVVYHHGGVFRALNRPQPRYVTRWDIENEFPISQKVIIEESNSILLDIKSNQFIADIFAKDIEYFGYEYAEES